MPSLLTILGLDGTNFAANLNKATAMAGRAGSSINKSLALGSVFGGLSGEMAKLGAAFSAGAILRSVVETANRINDLTREFRVSSDTVQRWDIAFGKVGLGAEDAGNALNRLKKAREGAIKEGNVGAFGAFGIGLADLRDQAIDTQDILNAIMATVAGRRITDSEDAAAMELMGKSGAKVLSAFQELSKLGPVKLISKEDLDTMHEVEETWKRFKRDAVSSVAPAAGFLAKANETYRATWTPLKMFYGGKASAREGGEMLLEAWKSIWGGTKPGEGKAAATDNVYRKTATIEFETKERLARIEALREQLAEKIYATTLKGLSVEQQKEDLKRKIAEHDKKSQEYEFGEGDDVKALEEKLKAAEFASQLAGLQNKHEKADKPDVNSLQKIGAYAANPALDKQILILERLERETAEMLGIARANKTGGTLYA